MVNTTRSKGIVTIPCFFFSTAKRTQKDIALRIKQANNGTLSPQTCKRIRWQPHDLLVEVSAEPGGGRPLLAVVKSSQHCIVELPKGH